jgi:hypothetical protein
LCTVDVVLLVDSFVDDLPPHPAIAKVAATAAESVSMAVSGVLFMGRAPFLCTGLGRPPYQAFV